MEKTSKNNNGLKIMSDEFYDLHEISRELIKQVDQLYKLTEFAFNAKKRDIKDLDELRKQTVEQLKQGRYFFKQAHWLQERFPEAELKDVEGLVKLVSIDEIKANDWSLTPGRYVGVTPVEADENFDFEERLRNIHVELADLNSEASLLVAKIQMNFEELCI